MRTISESPARALKRALLAAAPRGLRIGATVCRRDDPRHEGIIRSMVVANDVPQSVRVVWVDNGWVEDCQPEDLQLSTGGL